MSARFSWEHAFMESDLSSATRTVLLVIATHINKYGGGIFPSVKRISRLSGMSERSVFRHVKIAVAKGWLLKTSRRSVKEPWLCNEYQPAFPPDGSTISSPPPDNLSPGGDDTMSPAPDDKKGGPPDNMSPPSCHNGTLTDNNNNPYNSNNSKELLAAGAARKKKQDQDIVPCELKRRLWATGKKYLTSSAFEGGKKITEERAGQIIGRWRKELKKALGEEAADVALLNALAKADAEAAADPIGFIEACIAAKLTKGKRINEADVPPENEARFWFRMVQTKEGRDDPQTRRALSAIAKAEKKLGQLPPDLIEARQQCRKYLGMAA